MEPQKESQRKPVSFLYVASSLLTVAFLALGITVINSYDRLKNLETAFHRIDIMSENTTEVPMTNVISVGANVEPLDSEADAAEDTEATEETDGSSETQSESKTDHPRMHTPCHYLKIPASERWCCPDY